ncbi:hypothetical protein HYW72_00770 [Candidatus Nomurabacteria bacterium]|nr:hypothetical protein [Candidatus Nomurabacteria bacterium]
MNNHHSDKTEEKLHPCSECGLFYKEKEWAERCEAWCKEHQSCNLDIISHAIKND